LLDSGEEDFFFDLEDGFSLCGWVLTMVDFEPELSLLVERFGRRGKVGKTYKHASSRRVPADKLLRKVLLTCTK
jgi:hypothetical protein